MTVPRSVAEVLAEHVSFEIDCIDRMYCHVYVPGLQSVPGAVWFCRTHLGQPYASTALLEPISRRFLAAIDRYAAAEGIARVDFARGQRKDEVAQRFLAGHDGSQRVLFIGRAQEKARVFRTEKRRAGDGRSYPWIVSTTAMVNHFYFYCFDDDFGPFFIKFCWYFPYNAKLCLNGHEWAKRQAVRAGIGFTALDNGFATVDDPAAVQAICDRLGPDHIDALLRKWLAILPHPYSRADHAAGNRYEISIAQAEFSLTQVLDRPQTGRIFFEQVIRDNLDLGRPDRVGLVFGRQVYRNSRHRFRTRVITDGVTPSLHIDYKHSTIKQYHKLGRALRTETTINDAGDFYLQRRLCNLPALRQVGQQANRRLLDVQRLSCDPTIGAAALAALTAPATVDGQHAAALRFGDPRVHALLSALAIFRLQPGGFSNADLRAHVAELLHTTPDQWPAGRMTYDLRRLRLHGLIQRIPHTRRYQVTATGLHHALLLTRVHDRVLRTGLTHLCDPDPPTPTPLRAATRALDNAIDQLVDQAGLQAHPHT
jgi:hypothetical protein